MSTAIDSNTFRTDIDPQDKYIILSELGRGSYATVNQVLDQETDEVFAAKILQALPGDDFKNLMAEVKLMTDLNKYNNPHIVKYIDAIYDQERGDVWVVMELCSKNSLRVLMQQANRPLDERETAYVMKAIMEGLVFLKQHKIVHRDIKAGNILVTDEGEVKMADFGVSKTIQNSIKLKTQIGSPYWMAPELLSKNPEYGHEVDIWAAGILACELLERQPPYADKIYVMAMNQIKEGPPYSLEGHKSELTYKKFSPECVDFVKRCLVKDQTQRATAEELLNHPFLKKASNLQQLIDATYIMQEEDVDRNSLDIEGIVRQSFQVDKKDYNDASVIHNVQIVTIQDDQNGDNDININNETKYDTAVFNSNPNTDEKEKTQVQEAPQKPQEKQDQQQEVKADAPKKRQSCC